MTLALTTEWNLLGWEEIQKESPDIPWLVEPLKLAPGAITIVAGRGYSRKTLAIQSLALSVACGASVWEDAPCTRGDVVHLDYEQGKRLTADRYRRIAKAMKVNPLDFGPNALRVGNLPRPSLAEKASVDSLEREAEGAKLIVVDSLAASMPGQDENSTSIRRHLDELTKLSERMQCTIILIHHSRKASQNPNSKEKVDPLSDLRGSSAIVDASQTIWHFEGGEESSTATLVKDRISGSANIKRVIRSIDVDAETLRITSVRRLR